MKPHLPLALLALASVSIQAQAPVSPKAVRTFLKDFESQLVPLAKDVAIAGFDSSISGQEADYKRSEEFQLKLKKFWANPGTFAKVKAWRDSKAIKDPVLKRQVEVIYLNGLGNQLPEKLLGELVQRQTEIEKTYNTHRAQLDGVAMSDNQLDQVLKRSTDSAKLEAAWKASKQIGPKVAPAIVELVKLRNRAAKELGFPNFQAMQLSLSEQDPAEIEKLFDELDQLTRKDYIQVKGEVDAFLAKRLNIPVSDLKPWHYQDRFFQEAPDIYPVDLDGYYAKADLVKLASSYYKGIGLEVDDILQRSDLFEKPGKYQHAFCTDIDHSGDVRILCSLKPNSRWAGTLLHELGHGVYSKFNDPKLPWLLRDSAHAFTTEAIANFFGRLASNPAWLVDVAGVSKEEGQKIEKPLADSLRLEQLAFSRWSQLMFRFEKAMYENPDQDLNKLWWDLAEKYQLLKRPEGRNEPDWASKIHVALYPAYYHNYLMGQLLASQLEHHIQSKVLHAKRLQSYAGKPQVGRYFIDHVFKPGMRYPWNEMIQKATGEKLTAKYYAAQFIR